ADLQRHEPHGHDCRPGPALQRPAGPQSFQPGGAHVTFDPAQRAVLAGLADVLIPAGDGMPSASAAAVAGQGLDQVLAAVPSLGASLANVLALAEGREPAEAVATLARADPAGHGVLTRVGPAARS